MELIALAQRGETPAYEALVRRYQRLAFRTAYVITGDAAEAEDAAQTAFIKAWQSIGRFKLNASGLRRNSEGGEDTFRPWLLTIVANESRNRNRSRGRHFTVELDDGLDIRSESELDSPEAFAELNERREELAGALNRLSDSDRIVVSMRYFLELTEHEMAIALDIPRGTVKSRLSRALLRLREQLPETARSNDGKEAERG